MRCGLHSQCYQARRYILNAVRQADMSQWRPLAYSGKARQVQTVLLYSISMKLLFRPPVVRIWSMHPLSCWASFVSTSNLMFEGLTMLEHDGPITSAYVSWGLIDYDVSTMKLKMCPASVLARSCILIPIREMLLERFKHATQIQLTNDLHNSHSAYQELITTMSSRIIFDHGF